MKSNIGKLFGVLVVGGSLITQTAVAQETKETCVLEVAKNTWDGPEKISSQTICIDGKTDEEILKVIEELKKETCQTPFCGCWLG